MRLAFTAIVEIIQERSVLKFFRNLKFTISTEVSSPIIAGTVKVCAYSSNDTENSLRSQPPLTYPVTCSQSIGVA